MKMIDNGHIKNWTPVIGQTCQACNRLRPREYGIEVTPVCLGAGRNFDNRVDRNETKCDLTEFSAGIYFISVHLESGNTVTKKVVKLQ